MNDTILMFKPTRLVFGTTDVLKHELLIQVEIGFAASVC
jgi:hypothetical protein